MQVASEAQHRKEDQPKNKNKKKEASFVKLGHGEAGRSLAGRSWTSNGRRPKSSKLHLEKNPFRTEGIHDMLSKCLVTEHSRATLDVWTV